MKAGLAGQHPVTRKELATLVLSNSSCSTLDDGEKHLFAWLFANKLLPSKVIVVTTADKAALVAANGLEWLDCMTSLEDLARKAGVGRVTMFFRTPISVPAGNRCGRRTGSPSRSRPVCYSGTT